jgi:glycosyltransferase involved in cell wall biosynthesis
MKVAFIITMHNHPEVTAQALLELFRTSRELPSVEFIVVDDGSTDSTTIVHQTLARMRYYFGVRVKLIRHETPKGYGLANQAGKCKCLCLLGHCARLATLLQLRASLLNQPSCATLAGIDASVAKYITLVNSDAYVLRGSLFAMWSTFRVQADVGVVGPMMIGKDSILAEAGGVVWGDGSPANFGRGDNYRTWAVSCTFTFACWCVVETHPSCN